MVLAWLKLLSKVYVNITTVICRVKSQCNGLLYFCLPENVFIPAAAQFKTQNSRCFCFICFHQ